MVDVFVHHVFEVALLQFGCSSSFSEDGSLFRASCAAMPRCVFSILREGLEPAHRVRGLALPAALRLPSWKLLCSGLVESSLVIIFANAVDFPVVCSGSLACGSGSKEKSQSKVYQVSLSGWDVCGGCSCAVRDPHALRKPMHWCGSCKCDQGCARCLSVAPLRLVWDPGIARCVPDDCRRCLLAPVSARLLAPAHVPVVLCSSHFSPLSR